MGFLIGVVALIAQMAFLTLRPELLVGSGRGGLLHRALRATSAGAVFYFVGAAVSVIFARKPIPRFRWGIVVAAVVLVAVVLVNELSTVELPESINLFTVAWAVVIPLVLTLLWFFPSVGAYTDAHREQ